MMECHLGPFHGQCTCYSCGGQSGDGQSGVGQSGCDVDVEVAVVSCL